jgi:hypothetical protein
MPHLPWGPRPPPRSEVWSTPHRTTQTLSIFGPRAPRAHRRPHANARVRASARVRARVRASASARAPRRAPPRCTAVCFQHGGSRCTGIRAD